MLRRIGVAADAVGGDLFVDEDAHHFEMIFVVRAGAPAKGSFAGAPARMERSYRGGICKIGVVGPESVAGGGVTIGVMPGIGRVGRVTLPFCRNVPDPSPVVGTGLNVDGGSLM